MTEEEKKWVEEMVMRVCLNNNYAIINGDKRNLQGRTIYYPALDCTVWYYMEGVEHPMPKSTVKVD